MENTEKLNKFIEDVEFIYSEIEGVNNKFNEVYNSCKNKFPSPKFSNKMQDNVTRRLKAIYYQHLLLVEETEFMYEKFKGFKNKEKSDLDVSKITAQTYICAFRNELKMYKLDRNMVLEISDSLKEVEAEIEAQWDDYKNNC